LSLTAEGAAAVAGWLAPQFANAVLVVSDGEQRASAPAVVSTSEAVVLLSATFGEFDANFDWSRRAVELDGVEVDVEESDMGRKPLGAVWSLEVPISVEA
jgi:hypothetical protein